MFRPTLKRSYQNLNDKAAYNLLNESTNEATIDYKSKVQQLYKSGSNMIVAPTLFSQTRNQKNHIVFNPLNFEWCHYPPKVQEMLNSQTKVDLIAKDAGVYKDLFWCFNGEEIFLWREGAKQQKRFKLPLRSEIIAFGQLQNASLHFKTQKKIILVAGIQNYIHLFGLDKDRMQCTDFKMCYQIENSSYIQKITFVDNNKILICSQTGQHFMFDFTAQLKIYKPQGNVIRRSLPYLPLLYPRKQRFCEQLLSSGEFIVSLTRQQKKNNWLYYKAKQLVRSLMDQNFNEEWITEQTKVQIFTINKKTYEINLVKTLTEDDIIFSTKSKSILKKGEDKQNANSSKIISINFVGRTTILQLVTKPGTFIKINLEKEFMTHGSPITIPSPNNLGKAGFFLIKKNIYQDAKESESRCLVSLGSNNLTITNDAIWYIGENSIETVKSNGITGSLFKSTMNIFSGEQWYLLTKKGYFKIRRIKPRDIIISMINLRIKIEQQSSNQKIDYQNNYKQFFDSLTTSIGDDIMIESLIEVLILKKTEIKLNSSLINYIQRFLRGNFKDNWRELNYELVNKVSQKEQIIQITPRIQEEIWQLIFKFENKSIKIFTEDQKQKFVTAYWQALKNIFYKRTNELFGINPSNLKSNKLKIDKIIKFFDRFFQFFKQKQRRQIQLENRLYIQRKQHREQMTDEFDIFKNKHVLDTTKRLEDSIQTQQVQNQKSNDFGNIHESSKTLEKEIIQAVAKIKSVIEAFLCLSDLKQCEKITSLWDIFKSKLNQRILKLKLIQSVVDRTKMRDIHTKLPELQLNKDLNILDWLDEVNRNQKLDLIDLKKLASWLSTAYFDRVLQFFQKRPDIKVKLLLHYLNICKNQIKFSLQTKKQCNISLSIELKNQHLYSEDLRMMLEQTTKYYIDQKQKAQEIIESQIKLSINKYLNSLQSDYSSLEVILNNIIEAVTLHNDQIINAFLEDQLVKISVSQKLILFKRLKRVEKKQITIQQLLNSCKPRNKKEVPLQRQFMDNFQSYLYADKQ